MTREKCGARVYVHGDEERTCANYADTCRWHKGWRELCEKAAPKGCKWAGGCTGTALEGGRYCDEHTDVMYALADRNRRYMASRLESLQAARSAAPLAIVDPVRPEPNTVDHPRHYNVGKIEAITVIEDWNLGFNLGNAVKYIARADHKGNPVEDLKKALWYLQRELDRRNTVSR
jgi:hypothetical protein